MFEEDFVQDDVVETVETAEQDVQVESEPEPVDPTPTEEADSQPQSRDNDFARMRRSMEEQFKSSTEYKLAQRLADKYGTSVQEMMERLEEQELQEKATKENIPVEYLKREQEREARLAQLENERMMERINRQVEDFKSKNQDIKDDDLIESLRFLGQAHRMGMETMTLEQAFKAVNPNYETNLRERIRQEVLAEMVKSDTPLVTKGTAADVNTRRTADDLSDEEFDKLIERAKSGERITRI